ncbi:MAG: hypothetical protein ABSE93_21085 [Terriglobia bacterium]
MVNRRKFVATLSGCVVFPALSRALERSESKPAEAAAGARSRVDLNGQWERRIDGELYDVRDLKDSEAKKDLISLAETVWTKTQPLDWRATERPPQEVQELDQWLLSRMGTNVTLDRLYSDLITTLNVRLTVAGDKNVQAKQGLEIDVNTVAISIAETVRPLLESTGFPESFIGLGATTQSLDFSRVATLEIECRPMMDQAILAVRSGSEDVLIDGQYPRSVAQVIIKVLLLETELQLPG